MQEDVDALEAQELMYATDPGGTAESSIKSDLAALRGRRALMKMLAREQHGQPGQRGQQGDRTARPKESV
jgi:vanillate O-demethylase monooxygenase subunit